MLVSTNIYEGKTIQFNLKLCRGKVKLEEH